MAQHGYMLRDASVDLRADREVVLAAVTRNGDALQSAADRLRADREVVVAAVVQKGVALRYAADELWEDLAEESRRGMVRAFVARNGGPRVMSVLGVHGVYPGGSRWRRPGGAGDAAVTRAAQGSPARPPGVAVRW